MAITIYMTNGEKHYFDEKEIQYHKHLSECPECAYLASRESARNGAIGFVATILIAILVSYILISRTK